MHSHARFTAQFQPFSQPLLFPPSSIESRCGERFMVAFRATGGLFSSPFCITRESGRRIPLRPAKDEKDFLLYPPIPPFPDPRQFPSTCVSLSLSLSLSLFLSLSLALSPLLCFLFRERVRGFDGTEPCMLICTSS